MFRPCCTALILLLTATTAGARTQLAPAAPVYDESAAVNFPAQQQRQEEERPPGPANLEEAIEIALKRYGGRAADADTVVRDGQRVHEIRVFGEDGVVRTVRVDPETGRILPQRRNPD